MSQESKRIPTLYGNGVDDDTPAAQAMAAGEEYIWRGEILQGEPGLVNFPAGQFVIDWDVLWPLRKA